MARELARRLDVECQLVPFATPGELADAAAEDVWDIGNIGAEPERAKTIAFTAAYVEIEATYIVPAGSSIQSIEEVDKAGNRINCPGAKRLSSGFPTTWKRRIEAGARFGRLL